MIEIVFGVIAGFAAHQTDRLIKPTWAIYFDRLSRYSIGGLTVILVYGLILARLNRAALRDGMLAIGAAFVSVAVGVAGGMIEGELTKGAQ
jgi:hypothetical protein